MTTWFVSRHPGAIEWARLQGLQVDRQVAHLAPAEVAAGDVVIGTLPVHLAAEVCARGARFLFLALDITPDFRGRELTAADMAQLQCRLLPFRVMADSRPQPMADAQRSAR